jgi:hypothetical protein
MMENRKYAWVAFFIWSTVYISLKRNPLPFSALKK